MCRDEEVKRNDGPLFHGTMEETMEDQVLMQAKGANGTLQLLSNRICILREGIFANLYDRQSRTELLLQQIRSIEFKRTMGGLGGYIAFHDDERTEAFEDFCVSFVKAQAQSFEAIKDVIQQRTDAIHAEQAHTYVELLHK
jgi:hypothetical protein